MDPITITTTIITLAAFIKELIDVGQNIKRSIDKVGENRRRIRDLMDDILGTLAQLASLSRGREDGFHVQELLDALGNLKADMFYVLSVTQQISAPAPRSGFRGRLQSQIKGWLERDDIEAQVKRLNKHVKKCYIQFTAFSAARIEHASVRVEQRLIVNSVENQVKLQRLEGLMAQMLVHTQFGQNVVNQTMQIIASDPRRQTLESQYFSVQVKRLLESLDKCTAAHLFHDETPYWDPAKPLPMSFMQPTSEPCVLHTILGIVLQIDHSPAQLSPRDTADMLLNLGEMLSSLNMPLEAKAFDTFSVKLFRYLAFGENGVTVGALPRLADALYKLSYRYRYELRHDLAVQASQQSVELCHFLSESAPNVDNRVLFLKVSITHSSNLRAARQLDGAISVARDALAICRSLLPKTIEFASTRPDWALQSPEYKFQAAECAQSFFCLSHALSDASRHREAFLTSKEGLEIVTGFSGAIPPPSESDIDGFFNHMCNMAEAGEFDSDLLADAVILYGNLSRIYPQKFSKEALFLLYARAYFSNHDAAAIRDLRLFLEPSLDSPPPLMDDLSTSTPWIDDWMVENTIHAIYALESVLGLDAVDCFKAHLIQTHFGIAIQVLRNKVSSLIMEPVIDWDACHLTFYQTYYAFMVLSRSERLLVLEVFYDLAVYARKNIDFSFTSQMNGRFSLLLWCYCCMLRQVACPSDALAITEDAVRYNLSQTTPETDEVDWLGLQALVLADMGRFAEAETVLHDAKKRWNSPNPHWLLTVVESSILRQTGRVDQALLLLENSTSSIAKSASDTTPSDTWFIYFLFSDLSSTQLDVGQTQNALETAKRAVVKCRELHFSYPHKLRPRLAVAYALTTLSNCLAAVGRSDAGLAEAREAVTIYAGLPWRQFCPVGYRPEEFSSKAFHTLSLRLAASGHPDEALINAEKAVEEYRELVSLAIRYTPSLADGLRNLALRLWDVDRCDESIRALKEAISILQGVADQLPMAHHLPALADALELLAEHLPMQGDAAGASAAVFECFDIRGRLAHSAVSAEGEELHIEKVRDIGEVGCGTRFEMKIELKSSPLDVVWWILVAALGLVCAGLALALARK